MQSQTHPFIINGSPMPCLQAGSGEPLLLIHGALANHTLWLEHIEQLSHHYTVYAPTLRHFGEAGKEGPFGLETHAGDLLALLEQLPFTVWRQPGGHHLHLDDEAGAAAVADCFKALFAEA